MGIDSRTVQRWKQQGIGEDGRAGPTSAPGNKLTAAERGRVLDLVNDPEHRDLSPKQIVPRLAEEGIYVGSESTIYRVLREENQLKFRTPTREPQPRPRPQEHVAHGPCEVWSWDITYLRSCVLGRFYYLYMAMDVWSRKIVGWAVHEVESTEHAARLLHQALDDEGINGEHLVWHSDNGSPMKGATLLATLQQLGAVASFSRPSVSNDNPYSEAGFRTMKYRPDFPSAPFPSLEAARAWVASFVHWYNHEHRHSGIRYVTPQQRHEGDDQEILARRQATYEKARARHPERWTGSTRDWSPIETVTLNPVPDPKAAEAA
jgi:transposase InsO family protein